MNIIEQLEKEGIAARPENAEIPDFGPGDTLRVNVKVVEGTRERIQVFEGVCIGRKNAGINSAFTVRKISYGEGVERVFPLYSPRIAGVEVIRRGRVRRAKLYYLRGRTGKAARIAEKSTYLKDAAKKKATKKAVPADEKAAQKITKKTTAKPVEKKVEAKKPVKKLAEKLVEKLTGKSAKKTTAKKAPAKKPAKSIKSAGAAKDDS